MLSSKANPIVQFKQPQEEMMPDKLITISIKLNEFVLGIKNH